MEISLNLTSCHGPRQPASLTTPPPPPDSAGLQFAGVMQGGSTFYALPPIKSRQEVALNKKKERAHNTTLWARLELLAPQVDENKGKPGYRSKALRGRSKEELLKDVVSAVRSARTMAPGALQ
eukprot:CAMPEP_0180405534 /NCGR_PEP_ID=MMETSP0989-20121125/40661_1 /TAXON_ID=697907 /ORGANISM="non described non described, Strain CCMP2293" /LENGTH=122 /DNA_ID=CAMNT_0022409145 /DNA_START=276 /DNA_END=642 /DNA_ORIENTATION=-